MGVRTERPLRKPMLCSAQQTRPKKAHANKKALANKKSAKLKIQEERKASTNLLALQEHIPTMWEHGPKTGPETAALRCRANQTERKRELAKLASKEAGRTHLAGDDSREEKRKQSKQALKKHFVSIHKSTSKHQRQHTRRTATPTQRPPPPPAPNRHPPPPTPPKKHQPTNAKFWLEFWNNAMELREHGNGMGPIWGPEL